MKHTYLVALSLAIVLAGVSVVPAGASAPAPGSCTSGSLTIVGTEVRSALGCSGVAVIPNSMTVIRSSAFEEETLIHTITFQEGSLLTTIENQAFALSGITEISIPAGVTTLGYRSFYSTASLTTIRFAAGSSLATISDETFVFSGITSIEIPAAVSSIGTDAFERTDDLGAVTFAAGSSLTALPDRAFHYSGLSSIVLPSTIQTIGAAAFFNNQRLTSVTIPAAVTSIGNQAFGSTSSLTTIRFEGLAAPTLGTNVFADSGPSATASIKYNATGFDLVSGFWNGLLVSRDAAPVSSSPALPPPVPTKAPAITKSFALDTPFLAKQQKKKLRTLIKQVGAGGSFEVVAGVALSQGVTKRQAKALALAKARAIKNYLVLRGVKKKDVSLKIKIYKVGEIQGSLNQTLVFGSTT